MSSKIKLSEAKNLYKAYRDDKRTLLLKALKEQAIIDGRDPDLVNESKLGWISLEALKTYITEIETKGGLCNINSADLGFSIYYGAYADTDVSNPNQLTSLFIPTVEDNFGKKNDVVFTKTGNTLSIKKIKEVTNIDIVGEEKSILNRVGQVPPPEVNTNMDTLINNLD